eukprot:5966762-Karenia_brevis.AAC.1
MGRQGDFEDVSERSDPISGIDLAKGSDAGTGHGDGDDQVLDETLSEPQTAEAPNLAEAVVLSETDSEDDHTRVRQVVTWINISGKRGFRRLHRWNGCSRRPLADRMSYELYA